MDFYAWADLVLGGSIAVSTFFLWRIAGKLDRMWTRMETLLHEAKPPSRVRPVARSSFLRRSPTVSDLCGIVAAFILLNPLASRSIVYFTTRRCAERGCPNTSGPYILSYSGIVRANRSAISCAE